MIKAMRMESEIRMPGRMKGDDEPIKRLKKKKKKKKTKTAQHRELVQDSSRTYAHANSVK